MVGCAVMGGVAVFTVYRHAASALTCINSINDRRSGTAVAQCTIGLVGGQDCIKVTGGMTG